MRIAGIAKRIASETEVALLIRAAPSKRDRILIEVAYAYQHSREYRSGCRSG